MSDHIFPYEQSNVYKSTLWAIIYFQWAIKWLQISFVSDHIFPYERSDIYKSALWAIIYFPMSDQKHSYDRSHSSSDCSLRVFWSNFFHHALEIYFPYIQWLHHKGIVSVEVFTKICLMSVHNMFMSDQTFINQLCDRSYISLWAIKSIIMITHTLVLSAHRGFFCPLSLIMLCKSIFPISSDYTTKEL